MIKLVKMVAIEFDYRQIKTIIQANLNDRFETVLNIYKAKTNIDINNLYYLVNGRYIDKNDIIKNIMNSNDNQNKTIKILVNNINSSLIQNNNLIKSKDIICPECKEICKMEIKDYRIKLYDCKKGHVNENLKLDEFIDTQNIDFSKIICDKCKDKNRAETYNNAFYKCCECNMNLCSLCKSIHDDAHSIINYDHKDYICIKHEQSFLKYCENCKINICLSCIEDHKNHKMVGYEEKIINIKKIRKRMNELKKTINKFKENIEEIIMKFRKVAECIEKFYNINNDILNYYEKNKSQNYEKLINLDNIKKNINNEIKNIINNYSYGHNLNKMLYLYNNMYNKNEEIEMKYIPNENNSDNVQIFGENFICNNKYKCKIIYNNEEYELTRYFNDINNQYKNQDPFTFKLKGINNITDMSFMFDKCKSLSSIPDISKWNTSKVNNMSFMFSECISLSSLPDISKWDTSNVNNMTYMFYYCKLLSSLPDISKWNISNVNDISRMFHDCERLSSFPDLSKWNTSNVNDISWMFSWCLSLSSLPDISKWYTSNVIDMSFIFSYSVSLTSLPDISKWDTSNTISLSHIFWHCSSLSSLPDISKWDTSKVKDLSCMFKECNQSLKIPSKFNK